MLFKMFDGIEDTCEEWFPNHHPASTSHVFVIIMVRLQGFAPSNRAKNRPSEKICRFGRSAIAMIFHFSAY